MTTRLMTRQAFLTHLALEAPTLEFWLMQEWLVPAGDDAGVNPADSHAADVHAADVRFSEGDVARARLIQELKERLGVNDEGVDVILHLLDQLHGFRRAFEDLHADLSTRR